MKIICVGRNYAKHAEELKNEVPKQPVVFLKPETALLKDNKPFFYPEFSQDVHHEAEVVIRINRNGRYVEPQFSHRYFSQVTLGVDFTARDLQSQQKAKGLPWEIAKGFDNSAAIGQLVNLDDVGGDIGNLNFSMDLNGKQVQTGNTADMLFHVHRIISYVSQFFFLKIGDLIFTGTPQGVGPVALNDRLIGKLEGKEMFDFRVK